MVHQFYLARRQRKTRLKIRIDYVIVFLRVHTTAINNLKYTNDKNNVVNIAFLANIFHYINYLSFKVQGDQKLIRHLVLVVNCFCRKF